VSSLCDNGNHLAGWLRIEYDVPISQIASVKIYNRLDSSTACQGATPSCAERIVGGTVFIGEGAIPANPTEAEYHAKLSWKITTKQDEYNFGLMNVDGAYVEKPSHEWDFRGCTDGSAVVDSGAEGGSLVATAMNGASCSAEGMEFDGGDDYVDIDDWEWGGEKNL